MVPGFRLLEVTTVMLYSLFLVPSLFLLVMPVSSHGWSRPLWYQVGLDLQPWGCQPNSLDNCRSSLGCPGYWMGLGGNRIYHVAGVTITTTMMLVISRVILHRWRAKVAKGQVSTALLSSTVPASPDPWAHLTPPPRPFSYQPGLGPVGFLPDPVLIPVSCSCISTELMSTTNPFLFIPQGQYSGPSAPTEYPHSSSSHRGPQDHLAPGDPVTRSRLLILFGTYPTSLLSSPIAAPPGPLHSHAGPIFQLPPVTTSSCKHWKRQPIVSDRTLVLRVLHMLDAILLHIEGHLQRLASQQQIQIKEPPTQSG